MKKLKYVKLFENFSTQTFYHGSSVKLRIGTILEPQLEFYTRRSDVQFLEKIMYAYRPDDKLSRYDSVFLVDNIDDIDSSGGYTDFIYEVSILDVIIPEKSDLAWYTELELIESDDYDKQKEIAGNYWNGVRYHKRSESLFEYRVPKARVVELVEDGY